jgi:uncharacterized oxidoreductase
MLIDHKKLRKIVSMVIEKVGSERAEAKAVADGLVGANLAGHDSHGVVLLQAYVESVREMGIQLNQHAKIVVDNGSCIVVDGQRGFGQVIAGEAMDFGIERVREHGLALVALRNSHHIGRVGQWAEQASSAGLISIHFVNAIERPPIVAPFRGSDSRFGTNPFVCGLPATNGDPVVLDMATSGVAHGKIRVARNKEEKVAPGLLIDANGQPTIDPNVMFSDGVRGSLLPMGLHKGYGLAMICELLAGALTGGGVHREGMNITNTIINNMLVIIIDPAQVADGNTFAPYVDAFTDWVKESPAADPDVPVLVPGDPERRMRADRLAGGIPLDENTWGQIIAAGEHVGLERDVLTALATD